MDCMYVEIVTSYFSKCVHTFDFWHPNPQSQSCTLVLNIENVMLNLFDLIETTTIACCISAITSLKVHTHIYIIGLRIIHTATNFKINF